MNVNTILEIMLQLPAGVALVWMISRYLKVSEEKNVIQERRIHEAKEFIQMINPIVNKIDEMALLSGTFNERLTEKLEQLRKDLERYQTRLIDEINRAK